MREFPVLLQPPPLPEARSLVGVLCAIGGNIVISLGLNVQKLSHNQLRRESSRRSAGCTTRKTSMLARPTHSLPTCPHPECAESLQGPSRHTSGPVSVEPVESPYFVSRSNELGGQDREAPPLFATFCASSSLDVSGPTDDNHYLKSKSWWAGLLLMILGEFGNFAAYAFTPASVIAPLGTVTLISNALLAHLILDEKIRKQDVLGIVLAICGAIVVVMSSKAFDTQFSPEALNAALRKPNFIIYVICTLVIAAIMLFASENFGHKYSIFDLALVAIFGGYTVLSTKAISSLLDITSICMFEYRITCFFLILLVVTAILQIKYLNKALQRFDSTEVIPTQWMLFTVSAIIGSGVLYNDFDKMTRTKAFTFVLGCVMTFAGVYFITSNRHVPDLAIRTLSETRDEEFETAALLAPAEAPLSVPHGHHEPYDLRAACFASSPAALRRATITAAAPRSLVVSPLTSPSILIASSSAAASHSRCSPLLSASAPILYTRGVTPQNSASSRSCAADMFR